MTVVGLLDVAGPTVDTAAPPATGSIRPGQSKGFPGVTVGRMFENTAPGIDRFQRSFETTIIVTELILMWLSWRSVPIAPPALARRVRHDRGTPWIIARIALTIPRIDIGHVEIAAVRFNEERGNHDTLLTLAKIPFSHSRLDGSRARRAISASDEHAPTIHGA
jgi:hypothetical protein